MFLSDCVSVDHEAWAVVLWLALGARLVITRLAVDEEDVRLCGLCNLAHVIRHPFPDSLSTIFTVGEDVIELNGKRGGALKQQSA